MKLIQYYLPGKGKRVGVVVRSDVVTEMTSDGNRGLISRAVEADEIVIDVTSDESPGVLELIELSYKEGVSMGILLADIQERVSGGSAPIPSFAPGRASDDGKLKFKTLDAAPDTKRPHLLTPIDPPEVWGCGVTYKRSADMRDEDSAQDIYSRVYNADRPELFFKATTSRCVGHNAPICIRSDSKLTATEPELAYVLGEEGEIVGYTICNDVSAWDIERENPLYLPQSKIFYGCCALGPVLVTASEIDDPYNLNIKCVIIRNKKPVYEGTVNTSQINWKLEELTEFLCRDNPIPIGTVVSTGTGIIVPNDLPLAPGDIVEIEINGIGKLSNPVKQL
jgi:2-dehydro-3-deoxy-D-arabinonate dehydratase